MSSARGLVRRLASPGARATLAGLLDQVVISLANLAMGLVVLRLGTKEEFGLYGLSYTAILLVTGFSAALFGGQLTVAYWARPAESRPGFAGALVLTPALLGAGIAAAAFAAAWAAGFASLAGTPAQQAVAVSILACAPAMAHDTARSYRFLLHQPGWALGLDLLNAGLWLGLTLIGIRWGVAEHVAALGGYGLACTASALTGLHRSGLAWPGLRRAAAAVRAIWDQGRWALAGVGVTALQNQAHLYLLAALAGTAAVAEVNAARMIVSPLSMIVAGVNRGTLPRLARLRAEGREDAMARLARTTLLLVLAMNAGYLLAVYLFWDLLTGRVLVGDYGHIGVLVLLWALAFAVVAVDANMSLRLQVDGRFRSLTLLNLWTAIPTVALAVPMILWLGAVGSLLTITVGLGVLATVLAVEARRPAPLPGSPGAAADPPHAAPGEPPDGEAPAIPGVGRTGAVG